MWRWIKAAKFLYLPASSQYNNRCTGGSRTAPTATGAIMKENKPAEGGFDMVRRFHNEKISILYIPNMHLPDSIRIMRTSCKTISALARRTCANDNSRQS